MLVLNDGRKQLYQWDTGRTASVSIDCDIVHFSNLTYGEALAVQVKNGEVEIPNQLLANGSPVHCWAFILDENGAYTKQEQTIDVIKRGKPSDYVYTQTEVITIQAAVENALEKAKESGDFKGDKGDKGEKGEKGDKGADGTMTFEDLTAEQKASLKGDKGDKGDTGYTPQRRVDYWTEDDKAEIVKEVLSQDCFSLDQIIDPDNNPITESSEITVDFVMETGALDSTGVDTDSPTQIRSDFISVTSGSGLIYASPEWKDYLRIIGYNADKVFVEKKRADVGSKFTIPDTWAYLRFYTGATDAQFTFVTETPETKAEFKKIYFADHGYSIYGAPMDDETMHKLVVKAEGKDGNHFNIIEVKAPPENPEEATIALMNLGNGFKQFVDFSSMVYNPDNPTVEIVCQTRGNQPLPEFSVRYNDGNGAGRVKKLVVMPDCIPIKLTNAGIEVRRNNNYNNNATAEELVTVNLADLYDKVNVIYDALIANGTITE